MSAFWFIIGFMFVGNVGWWLWADRRLRPLPAAGVWRTLLALFIGLQLAYLIFFFAMPVEARRAHLYVPQASLGVFYLWCLIILPITILLTLLLSGVRGVARWTRSSRMQNGATAGPGPATDATVAQTTATTTADVQNGATARLTRRQILAAAAVAIPPLVTGVGVGYGRHAIRDLRVRRAELAIPGLPPDLDGLTIAHLTDVHVGKFVDDKYLRLVRDTANSLRADLHLLTGDLIDLSLSDLPGALDFVTALDPKHGLLMCEGNHDLIESPRAFYQGVSAKRIPLLLDEAQAVRLPGRSTPLRVLGARWGGHNDVGPGLLHAKNGASGLMDQVEPGEFPLLLAHHPHMFDAAAEAGIPLTLAGHTHGGLIMLSERVGPAAVLYKYWSGLYRKGNSSLFVSNGVGSWYPIRINARPEIVHLTLRATGAAVLPADNRHTAVAAR